MDLILLTGIGCTVVALPAILPAIRGHLRLSILMAAPAFVYGVLITFYLVYDAFLASHPSLDADVFNVLQIWMFYCGIPLTLSSLALLTAVVCSQRKKRHLTFEGGLKRV
jgi:hypothetical protein